MDPERAVLEAELDEARLTLARVYASLCHNPEGLNLMDVQRLTRPYAGFFRSELCRHFYNGGRRDGRRVCVKCGEAE